MIVRTNYYATKFSMFQIQNKKQSRFWIFTLNNFSEEEENNLRDHLRNPNICSYAIFGRETGTMGTSHLQGYIELRKSRGLGAVKEIGNPFERMHLEIRRGTRAQATNYCKKDGDFEEFGEYKQQSQTEKMSKDELRELALSGGSRAVANDPRATLHNIRTARALLEEIEPPRSADEPIIVHWYFGRTGIGKSRRARWEAESEFGPDEVYRKADPSKWFNGYDRHKAVIIDDYRDSWWYFTEILRLLDRYPTQVEVKGGM
ncbi:MAG: hypothetical protein QXX12_06760, partial [Nanopusillaceae archaeon]